MIPGVPDRAGLMAAVGAGSCTFRGLPGTGSEDSGTGKESGIPRVEPPLKAEDRRRRRCACPRGCHCAVYGADSTCDFCFVETMPQPACDCGDGCCESPAATASSKARRSGMKRRPGGLRPASVQSGFAPEVHVGIQNGKGRGEASAASLAA